MTTHTHTHKKKKKKGTKFTCLITLLGQDGCNERAYLTPTTLEQQRFRKAGTFDAVLFFFLVQFGKIIRFRNTGILVTRLAS